MIFAIQIGFLEVNLIDVFDIALVSILLYQVYKLMRGSVAVRIFLGFLSLYLIFLIVSAAEMELLSAILGQFMGVGVLAALVLFQQEIRKFLMLIGKTTSINRDSPITNLWKRRDDNKNLNITPIIESVKSMSRSNTGALIVFSKSSPLKFYQESGDMIDAVISKRLFMAIFNKYSPLHDGAAIIFEGRIKAARCILPVSERDNLPAQFGLRHRAAIGMSEITDTIITVVSEETGQISVVRNGKIEHNLTGPELRQKLLDYYFEEPKKQKEAEPEADAATAPQTDAPTSTDVTVSYE